MELPSGVKLDLELNPASSRNLWNEVSAASITTGEQKVMQTRGSSLPFCKRMFWLAKKLGPFEMGSNFRGDVCLDRGHAIHATVQKWIGRAEFLYGNWECPICAVLAKYKQGQTHVETDRFGPPGCCPTHRKVELVYQEYELAYKGLTGHPDALIRTKLNLDYPDVLGEFKTCGFKTSTPTSPSWSTIRKDGPPWHQILQCNSYCCILNRVHGHQLKKIWLWYISADRPFLPPVVWQFTPNQRWLDVCTDRVVSIKRSYRRNWPPPLGNCDPDQLDKWCGFADVCQHKDLHNLITESVRSKRRCL